LVSRYLNDTPCKNYNYTFVFVKVIPKTLLVPFFSGHGVETASNGEPLKYWRQAIHNLPCPGKRIGRRWKGEWRERERSGRSGEVTHYFV